MVALQTVNHQTDDDQKGDKSSHGNICTPVKILPPVAGMTPYDKMLPLFWRHAEDRCCRTD
jgi:hypothetical protein